MWDIIKCGASQNSAHCPEMRVKFSVCVCVCRGVRNMFCSSSSAVCDHDNAQLSKTTMSERVLGSTRDQRILLRALQQKPYKWLDFLDVGISASLSLGHIASCVWSCHPGCECSFAVAFACVPRVRVHRHVGICIQCGSVPPCRQRVKHFIPFDAQ